MMARTPRRRCPACPDDGYAWVTVGMDSSSPSGIVTFYQCWHGIVIDPPEWSVQAETTREGQAAGLYEATEGKPPRR